MSARRSAPHAPHWLHGRRHGVPRELRHLVPDARSVHGPVLWPVLLVIALAVGADIAEVTDVAVSHQPLGLRMQTGLSLPPQRALSARATQADPDDALLSSMVADVPPASVEAIVL